MYKQVIGKNRLYDVVLSFIIIFYNKTLRSQLFMCNINASNISLWQWTLHNRYKIYKVM